MTASERSSVRRALRDNPARAHADIAVLFGLKVFQVTALADDLRPYGERQGIEARAVAGAACVVNR